MATISATQVDQAQGFATLFNWGAMSGAGGDVGQGVYVGNQLFLCGQAVGTNTATVTWQGSMDNTNWNDLNTATVNTVDASGVSKAIQLVDMPLFVRPKAGVAALTNVFLCCRRTA
jgi:hypothetical protein